MRSEDISKTPFQITLKVQPQIEVIITTKEWPESLTLIVRILESVSNVKRVFIVGNGPRARLKTPKLSKVEWVELREAVLPGHARNFAIGKIRSPWVLFLDDDARIHEGLFESFVRIYNERPQIDAWGGPNLTPRDSKNFSRLVGKVLACRLVTWSKATRYRLDPARECDPEALTLCNLFLRTKFLRLSGGFKDFLICAEENELLGRLREKGARFAYSPLLAVEHWRRADFDSYFRQILKYGVGRGQLENLNRESWPIWLAALVPCAIMLQPATCTLFAAAYGAILLLGLRNPTAVTIGFFTPFIYGYGVIVGWLYQSIPRVRIRRIREFIFGT